MINAVGTKAEQGKRQRGLGGQVAVLIRWLELASWKWWDLSEDLKEMKQWVEAGVGGKCFPGPGNSWCEAHMVVAWACLGCWRNNQRPVWLELSRRKGVGQGTGPWRALKTTASTLPFTLNDMGSHCRFWAEDWHYPIHILKDPSSTMWRTECEWTR